MQNPDNYSYNGAKNNNTLTLLIVSDKQKVILQVYVKLFQQIWILLILNDLKSLYSLAVLALLLLNDAERYSRLSSDDSSHD